MVLGFTRPGVWLRALGIVGLRVEGLEELEKVLVELED